MRNLITIAALLFALPAMAQGTGPMRPDQNIPFSGNNTYTGQNAEPPCSLVDASSITISVTACASSAAGGVGYNTIVLTANGHTIAYPSGTVIPGSGFQLDINEGSGPYSVSVAAGLFFPPSSLCTGNGTPVAYCTAANQLVLSGVANGKNAFYCRAFSPTEYHCGAVQAGLTQASVAPTWSVPSNSFGSQCSSSGSTTCAGASLTITSGDHLIIWSESVGNAGFGTPGPTIASIAVAAGSVSGCAQITGSSVTFFGYLRHETWLCSVTGTGTGIPTVTYNANAFFAKVAAIDVHATSGSPAADGSTAGSASSGSNVTSSSVSTGATARNGEFILSFLQLQTSGTTITPAGTSLGGDSLNNAQWTTGGAPGTQTQTATWVTAQPYAATIVALTY